jgi:hypothetical protein
MVSNSSICHDLNLTRQKFDLLACYCPVNPSIGRHNAYVTTSSQDLIYPWMLASCNSLCCSMWPNFILGATPSDLLTIADSLHDRN